MTEKNWFGMTYHRTDSFINWHGSEKSKKKEAEALRQAYGQFSPDQLDALEMLLTAAYEAGGYDEHENNCGDSI